MSMNCPNCRVNFSLIDSLEGAKYSWPEMRTFWYKCIDCKSGNHIRISDGRYQQIEIVGAPGPDWEVISTLQEKEMSYRIDEKYLHVWLNKKHYEIKART